MLVHVQSMLGIYSGETSKLFDVGWLQAFIECGANCLMQDGVRYLSMVEENYLTQGGVS